MDIYHDLMEGLDAILWEADPETLKFTSVSPNAEALLGYPQSAWTANPSFRAHMIHPGDRQRALDAWVRAIKRRGDHRLEYRVMTADGRTLRMREVTRLTSKRRRPRRLYGILIDVTASQEQQHDAVEHSATAADQGHTRNMESIGRLSGSIAHEFNNLLTVILGFSQLVLLQLAPGTQLHRDVEDIFHAGTSAAALTRQLLLLSRKQVLRPQILDLNGIVSRMSLLLRRLIGETIVVTTRLTTPLDRIWADPGQIEQVILNLALNARDAMPHGGSLTVETANVHLGAQWVAEHAGASEGPHVMLAITDTGIGMDETVQAHLFEPFFTTKDGERGTGLGLATVYEIVKQGGGSILVRSKPDHGTTFRIFMPRTEQTLDPLNSPPPAPQPPAGTETILLVEDQSEVRSVTRKILARHGYNVLEAANGSEALSILEKHDGEVHLLLTDIVMPGVSGLELAAQLVTWRPDLSVLYMSGHTDEAVVHHRVFESGMAFIQKPFTPNALLQVIRCLLDAR